MKLRRAFQRSLTLSVTRSALPLASMIVVSLLNWHDAFWTSQFNVGLAAAGFVFAFIAVIGNSFQSEIASDLASEEKTKDRISQLLLVVACYSITVPILAITFKNLVALLFSRSAPEISEGAQHFFYTLLWCVPFVGFTNVCCAYLEAKGRSVMVSAWRTAQLCTQVGFVFVVLLAAKRFPEIHIGWIGFVYLCNDIAYSLIFLFLFQRESGWWPKIGRPCARTLSLARVLVPNVGSAAIGRFLLFTLAVSISGIGIMESAVYAQVSAALLFLALPLSGICAALAIDLGQHRNSPAKGQAIMKEAFFLFAIVGATLGIVIYFWSANASAWIDSSSPQLDIVSSNALAVLSLFVGDAILLYAMAISNGLGLHWRSRCMYWLVAFLGFYVPVTEGLIPPTFSALVYCFSVALVIASLGILLICQLHLRAKSAAKAAPASIEVISSS